MGETIRLRAADGHEFDGWLARPAGKPRGGLVVLQEIFGVNGHIRRVTESFAAEGYLAVAPALFDRVRPGLEIAYDQLAAGRDVMMALDRANTIRDMSAAVAAVRVAGKVGAIGYCWGGALADLAACECGVDAAVSYYGRHTATWLELKPKCPVMYHFGKLDPCIPPEDRGGDQGRAARGHLPRVRTRPGMASTATSATSTTRTARACALERTLEFLHRHVG